MVPPGPEAPEDAASADVAALIPMVRRIVLARVGAHPAAEDLVQETLARVLAASHRIEPGMLEPYAITTARNVVTSMWRDADRQRRNQHRVLDLSDVGAPDERMLAVEEQSAVARALSRLGERDRAALLAHEVNGQDTRSLAQSSGSSAGAVAAQLNRARARLRVEYLLELETSEPPTSSCRAVLLSLSAADRRRQNEVDAARHLLECDFCAGLSQPLLERGQPREDEVRVPVTRDQDVVAARQAGRELGHRIGLSATDVTVLATAVSEITRNIVRFAGRGEVLLEVLSEPAPGVRVTARDAGPGIPDVEQAMTDGYSTYDGLGLGLPGARRLMDEFGVVSEPGKGTTVSMTKWRREGRGA